MTTNTTSTASQAAGSIDTPEFDALLRDLEKSPWAHPHGERAAIIAHIDSKLAQEREEGRQAGLKHACRTIENSNDTALESLKQRDEWKARATAAEAKLEAIRQGIQTLLMEDDGDFVDRLRVSSLLQAQPQADESGMPG